MTYKIFEILFFHDMETPPRQARYESKLQYFMKNTRPHESEELDIPR